MKFTQIASSTSLTSKVVPVILSKSVLLANYIEFFKKPGSAISYRKAGASSDIAAQTRSLGNEYEEANFEPQYEVATRKFIGGQVKIDIALEKMGYDLASEFESNLLRHMKDFPGIFHNMLINGDPDTDPKQFAGLKLLAAAARTVEAAPNGLELLQGNDNTAKKAQQIFLEKVDETIALCEGNNKVLLMNARTISRMNSIAREYLTITKNEFGVPITMYNQVPMLDLGSVQTAVGTYTPIQPFDETQGTAVDKCASVYCASFEEEDGMSFATTEGGFTVYDIVRVDTWWKSTYELIVDSVLMRPTALSKLKGLYL
jgi:hypothetical protein